MELKSKSKLKSKTESEGQRESKQLMLRIQSDSTFLTFGAITGIQHIKNVEKNPIDLWLMCDARAVQTSTTLCQF
jgi:hypothetical protein